MKKARMKSNGKIPIYARFTLNSRRVELSTGIYYLPESGDETGQQIRGRNKSIRILNNRLNKIEDDIQDHYNRLKSSGDFDVTTIKNRLLNINDSEGILKVFDYYLKNMSEKLGKGYSKETYKHYKSSRKRLDEFVRKLIKRKDYPVEKVDYKFGSLRCLPLFLFHPILPIYFKRLQNPILRRIQIFIRFNFFILIIDIHKTYPELFGRHFKEHWIVSSAGNLANEAHHPKQLSLTPIITVNFIMTIIKQMDKQVQQLIEFKNR